MSGRIPQRSRLIANREDRSNRAKQAFSMFRPVIQEDSDTLYSRLKPLQEEDDIPDSLTLFNHDHHASIIQERRMRKGLVVGLTAGFAIGTALGHIESGLPGHGRASLAAKFKGVDVIGRNRNVLVGYIQDEQGILSFSREATTKIFESMGLHFKMDKRDHITLGSSASGLTATERKHVIHTAEEALFGLEVCLDPVVIEQHGRRMPLSDVKRHLGENI